MALEEDTMKRAAAILTVLVTLAAMLAVATDAWGRAGGGGSKGSRGSRSYSAPVRPTAPPASPVAPSRPSALEPRSPRPAVPSGLTGALGGFLLGGLLGSLLWSGGSGVGGMGLLDLAVMGVLGYVAWSWMRRRQPAEAPADGYATSVGREAPLGRERAGGNGGGGAGGDVAVAEDLARGMGHIRQVDPGFDPQAFAGRAAEIFQEVQAAWSERDLARVAGVLTPDIQAEFQRDCDAFRAHGKVNRLEQVTVHAAEVTEAWQERGEDFVTVRFAASLLDFTTDEQGRVLEGSAEAPVSCEEYWTFTRPVWAKSWRLSAVQQPV